MSDLAQARASFAEFEPFPIEGRVRRIHAGEIEADGPDLSIGAQCEILPASGGAPVVRAQVAAISDDKVLLVPVSPVGDLKVGDRVRAYPNGERYPVGEAFAGRAIDALGRPIAGRGKIAAVHEQASAIPALDRIAPRERLDTT